MKIMIDRDSICMGDDVFPHKMELDIEESLSIEALLKYLEEIRYLPNIHVDCIIWSCLNNGKEICTYFGQTQEWSYCNKTVKEVCENEGDFLLVFLHFYNKEEWINRIQRKRLT